LEPDDSIAHHQASLRWLAQGGWDWQGMKLTLSFNMKAITN
jgi:hypothetical protein